LAAAFLAPGGRMEDHSSAVPRTVIAVDVEGFGDRRRTNQNQIAIRAGLYRAVQEAFGRAQIPWDGLYHEDRGDSIFILAGPEVPKNRFVGPLPAALIDALDRHNSTHPQLERIRLRMALHAGEVNFDQHGVAGKAIVRTFRLLESRPVKRALADSAGVLAVITSSWFFEEVVRPSAADAAEYYSVRVAVKETLTTGWICLPGQAGPAAGPGQPGASGGGLRYGSLASPWRRTAVVAGSLLTSLVLLVTLAVYIVTHVHLVHSGHAVSSGAPAPPGPVTTLADPQSTDVYATAFSPGGKVLATADLGNVYLRSTADWQRFRTLAAPAGSIGTPSNVSSLAFIGDSMLAAGDFDGSTYVFSVATGAVIATLHASNPGPYTFGVESVAYSANDSILATADDNGSTYLWSTRTWTMIAILTDRHWGVYGVESVAFSPDGSMLVTGDSNGSAYLWDVATRTLIAPLTPPGSAGIDAVAFSPSGILATGEGISDDFHFSTGYLPGTYTYLWNTTTRKIIDKVTDPIIGLVVGVNSVGFSPDGTILATGDDDGNTYLHSTSTWKAIATLPDGAGAITSVGFSPSSKLLATADGLGASGTLASTYVWNVAKAIASG
jgi:WD40 domain-containing protein